MPQGRVQGFAFSVEGLDRQLTVLFAHEYSNYVAILLQKQCH